MARGFQAIGIGWIAKIEDRATNVGFVSKAAIASFKVSAASARWPRLLIGPMLLSDVDLLSDLDRIIDVDAKVPHGTLDL